MQPHWQQMQQRMAAHPVILCLADTTEPNFDGHETQGTETAELRCPARHVRASNLRRDARALAAGFAERVDVGAYVE